MSGKHQSAIILIAGLLLFVPACGGSTPTTSELCLDFTGDSTATPGAVTAQLSDDSECEAIAVEFIATDIDDVFAFQAHVTYDTDIVYYAGYSTVGSVLESDGADVAVIIRSGDTDGELIIGATRVSDVSVDADGSQMVMKLLFAPYSLTAASGDLTIDQPCLLGNGEPPMPKNGVACSGGTLRVQ
jgi:hypothetical protein